MQATSIQWTDLSFNPIRARRKDGGHRIPGHFCQKVSPGCANCYSSKTQPRFKMPQFPGTNKSAEDIGVEVFLDEKALASLLRRRKQAKIFWCDMSDLFGEWVPFEWIDKCFAVMALTPHLTHQILTKRPERMREYFSLKTREDFIWDAAMKLTTEVVNIHWPLPNVWLGTSVEDQKTADERIPHLLKCPAAVRFLSVEPLLGPVDLRGKGYLGADVFEGEPLRGIDWVIVGGESGRGARACDIEWIRSIVKQCAAVGVPVFVKQFGSNPCSSDGSEMGATRKVFCRDSKGGNPEEWTVDLRIRQFPETQTVNP